jgi:DNA-binding transcriptional ArsR family regulator
MVKCVEAGLDTTFGALADPTRRAILAQLSLGDSSVSDLAEPFHMSLPAVSKHLRVLASARLLTVTKIGRTRRCTLAAEPMKDAVTWMAGYRRFWEKQFDAMEKYLSLETQEENTGWLSRAQGKRGASNSRGRSRRPGK